MTSLLFVENSQPFPKVLLSVLVKNGGFSIDRAFSAVHAINKLKERSYNLVLICGKESESRQVQDAAGRAGTAYFSVDITPAMPPRERSGFLKESTLTVEDIHHSFEFSLSGYRTERELYAAASEHVLAYLRDHLESAALDSQNLRLFEALESSRMGVAIVSGPKVQKVSPHLATLLGYAPGDLPLLKFPDLFPSEGEYRDFSRAMSRDKNEAGWHCSSRRLVCRNGSAILCNLMVRRLDDFNPLKGHLIIIGRTDEPGQDSRTFQQTIIQEKVDPAALDGIIAGIPGIVLTTDPEGIISHANAAALSAFGYRAGEMTGKNLAGTIVPEGSRYARQMIAMINDPAFCRDGYAIHAFENQKKNGDRFWVAWKILALRDAGGRITGMLLLGEDITEYGAAEPARIRADPWKYHVLDGTEVQENVFDAVFHLCVEISREGREGHVVGTSFVIGDDQNVMQHSRPCTINSFEGQPESKRHITNPEIAEVIKGLAQMDGAFVIRGDGYIEASGRHFLIDNTRLKIPEGFGTRHSSVAGITQMTNAIGFVVSTTGGKITVMKNGEIKKTLTV